MKEERNPKEPCSSCQGAVAAAPNNQDLLAGLGDRCPLAKMEDRLRPTILCRGLWGFL